MADVKEPLQELFESIKSDILTEEVQLQIATLFEASLNEAIEAKEKELEEANKEEIAVFKEDLVTQTDNYLEYFTKEYIKENEQVIEDFTKVRLAEKVLRNFQQMVEAFNVSLSDESVSSEDEIESLKTENTKLVNKLIESRKETESVKKAAMIAEASEKLETDIQRDALVEKAKGLDFDEDIFESKLDVLVKSILSEKVEDSTEKLDEKVETPEVKKETSDFMKKYLSKL